MSANRLSATPAMQAALQAKLPAPKGTLQGRVPLPPAKGVSAAEIPSAPTKAAKRKKRKAAIAPVEALLREVFPAAFCKPRVPLAIGIHQQILDVAGDDINRKLLKKTLAYWVQHPGYLDAVAHGEPRRNLDGSVAGEPTPDQRLDACIKVYGPVKGPQCFERLESQRSPS